ncbi:MAG: hypothetical protein HY650_01805 [Acidobacteria bacterium]|nr:hypothetical protein [Acidobacteriota bacterium]
MNRSMLSKGGRAAIVFTTLLLLYHTTIAGPALICWPFDIGDAKSLPFKGPDWRAVQHDYPRGHLVTDTLQLLAHDSPVIVRMETLRRATVYAAKDPHIAAELLNRFKARAGETASKGVNDALAALDFGYLIECYRQARWMMKDPSLLAGLDGYAWIKTAIRRRGNDPQLEFAAAMVSIERSDASGFKAHRDRALAGATEGSLLGRNLLRQAQVLRLNGRSLAEMKSQAGLAGSR